MFYAVIYWYPDVIRLCSDTQVLIMLPPYEITLPREADPELADIAFECVGCDIPQFAE